MSHTIDMSSMEQTNPSANSLAESILKEIETTRINFKNKNSMSNPNSNTSSSGLCSVPQWLPDAMHYPYKPSLVFLGPMQFSRHMTELSPVDEKSLSVSALFRLNECSDSQLNLVDCIEGLRTFLGPARSFYDKVDTRKFGDDRLLRMLFFDGCFILVRLLSVFCEDSYDLGYRNAMNWKEELDELLLMNNQIPLFVLEHIIRFVKNHLTRRDPDTMLYVLGKDYDHWSFIFEYLFVRKDGTEEFKHLLHLYHYIFRKKHSQKNEHSIRSCWRNIDWITRNYDPDRSTRSRRKFPTNGVIHSATKLTRGGVVFKKEDTFREISFRKGKLSIPFVAIHDKKIMNMLAFEQCRFEYRLKGSVKEDDEMPVSVLMYFVAFMIRTSKDLELLENFGVTETAAVGSTEEILNFFSRIRTMVNLGDSNIDSICEAMNLFIDSQGNQWCVKLKRDYFSSPWTVISLLAAVYLLIMASLQTFYTVYPNYHRTSQ